MQKSLGSRISVLVMILTVSLTLLLSGCIQFQKREIEKIEAKPVCGNYLPKGWICPPSQEFIVRHKLRRVEEVKVNSPIELKNLTIVLMLNKTTTLVENIPEFFLAVVRVFLEPTLRTVTRLTVLPLEMLVGGNVTVEEIKQQPNVKIYEAKKGKEFVVIYLTLKNEWDDFKIKGRWEGILVTDNQKYLPKYILRHTRLWPTEELGNYTILDVAWYSVKPNSTEITLFVFEIDEDERIVEFVFNLTYRKCKLLCFREGTLRDMVVKP